MKVILLENISSLGVKGEVKEVSDGFASNFLIPQGKVILATADNLVKLKAQANRVVVKKQEQVDAYQKIWQTLNKQTLNFSGKVSDKNHLFKGVSIHDIITAVKEQFNLDVHEKWLVNPSLFKTVGRYSVVLKLPNNQELTFFINIKAI